jgi:hypothetical protein
MGAEIGHGLETEETFEAKAGEFFSSKMSSQVCGAISLLFIKY